MAVIDSGPQCGRESIRSGLFESEATASGSGSIVMTASAPATASTTSEAIVAPRAASGAEFAGSPSHTVVAKPSRHYEHTGNVNHVPAIAHGKSPLGTYAAAGATNNGVSNLVIDGGAAGSGHLPRP
jgi:hypothetical protein